MNAEASREFKFRIEDETPDRYLEAEADDRRFRKLNRRITWLAFLLPCLAGLLVAAGYLDLKGRLEGIDHVGVREMETMAGDLDARLSALAEKQSALVQSLTEKVELLSQRADALTADLKKTEAAFDQALERTAKAVEKSARDLAAPKIDRQELDKAVGQLQKHLEPIEKRLAAVSSDIASLDDNFSRELASVSGNLDGLNREVSALKEKAQGGADSESMATFSAKLNELKGELSKLRAQVSGASNAAIDQDYLDARLLKEQRIYQLKLDQQAEETRRKLSELQKQLSALQTAPSPSRS